MKNISKYIRAFLAFVLIAAVSACGKQFNEEEENVGLHVKVFFPTKVVAGQPMTINGSGFSNVTEIVFPSDVRVTDFEIVSNDMIRVTAPSGIAADGGKIIVRTKDDEVESALPLTIGHTVISGYSLQEGDTIKGGELLSIYGTDLEFICGLELLKDEEKGRDSAGIVQLEETPTVPLPVPETSFYRKGTSTVTVIIPDNVHKGTFIGKIFTYDGQEIAMPALAYEPADKGGHWETVKRFLWQNDGTPVPAWGGKFRFGLDGKDGNNECIATFDQDSWNIIKEGTVYFLYDGDGGSNVRITTGWWSAAYGGSEHNCIDMATDDEETGKKVIELNIKEEGSLYDLIDDQHLLFTGDAYTPIGLYILEEVWIEGEEGHWERNSFWKNDGTPIPSWGGTFRFGLDGNDGNNECIATFPADIWSTIKDGTFRVAVEVNEASNIRITTGWWSAAYGGSEHNCIDMVQEEEDGTKYIELNIKEEGSIYDLIDAQHLLFTGDNYTILEFYTLEWVEGGGAAKEVVLWEGEAIADDWGNQPNLLSDAGIELQEAGAKAGQEVRFYITPTDDFWQLEIVEGHWGGTYAMYSSPGADDGGRFTAWDLDAKGGYVPLTLTQEILDKAFVQQWWGGTFIGNGDNVKITKITLY